MLKTLCDLANKIVEVEKPLQSRVVVEFRTKEGEIMHGIITEMRMPKGSDSVVIFVEE